MRTKVKNEPAGPLHTRNRFGHVDGPPEAPGTVDVVKVREPSKKLVQRDVVILARRHTHRAIRTLVQIMSDPNENATARVRAAETLLSRGWGQAVQQRVDLVAQLSNDELAAAASEVIARQQKAQAGVGPAVPGVFEGGRLESTSAPEAIGGGARGTGAVNQANSDVQLMDSQSTVEFETEK